MLKKFFFCALFSFTSVAGLMAQEEAATVVVQDSLPTAQLLARMQVLRAEIDALTAMIGEEGERKFNDAASGQMVYDSLLQFSDELDDLSYILAEAIPFDADAEEDISEIEVAVDTAMWIGEEEDVTTDEDMTNVKPSTKKWKVTQSLGFGVGGWQLGSDNLIELTPNVGRSWFFDIGYGGICRLGGEKSPLSLGVGIGYTTQAFNLGDKTISAVSGNELAVSTVPGNVRSSSYTQNSFYVPLSLHVKVNSKMKVFAGGYAAYALPGRTKVTTTFDSFGDVRQETSTRRDFYATSFQYGALAGVSYRMFSLAARYQLVELFDSAGLSDVYPWSVGLYLNGK